MGINRGFPQQLASGFTLLYSKFQSVCLRCITHSPAPTRVSPKLPAQQQLLNSGAHSGGAALGSWCSRDHRARRAPGLPALSPRGPQPCVHGVPGHTKVGARARLGPVRGPSHQAGEEEPGDQAQATVQPTPAPRATPPLCPLQGTWAWRGAVRSLRSPRRLGAFSPGGGGAGAPGGKRLRHSISSPGPASAPSRRHTQPPRSLERDRPAGNSCSAESPMDETFRLQSTLEAGAGPLLDEDRASRVQGPAKVSKPTSEPRSAGSQSSAASSPTRQEGRRDRRAPHPLSVRTQHSPGLRHLRLTGSPEPGTRSPAFARLRAAGAHARLTALSRNKSEAS